ncbi:MAG: hypothetical protein AAF764_10295, partial [Pseudomonadota bacterium]
MPHASYLSTEGRWEFGACAVLDSGHPKSLYATGQAMLNRIASRAVIWLPYIWLAIFFLAPFALVAKLSLSQPAIAMPPYLPAFDFIDGIRGW